MKKSYTNAVICFLSLLLFTNSASIAQVIASPRGGERFEIVGESESSISTYDVASNILVDDEGNPLYTVYLIQVSDHKYAPIKGKKGWVLDIEPELAALFNTFSVYEFAHAFPDATIPELERTYTLQVSDPAFSEALQKNYRKLFPMVELAPFIYPLYTPNDYYSSVIPSPKSHWHLDAINAEAAWDVTTGRKDVVIGVFEFVGTYFNTSHEDMKDQFYDVTRSGGGVDHATAVSHLASGNTNNQTGLASIGFNTKVFGTSWRASSLSGDFNYVLQLIKKGVRVINMSFYFGNSNGDPIYSATGDLLVQNMYNAGGILIAGAGNHQPNSTFYPASYDNVLSVTSVGPDLSHVNSAGATPQTHAHNADVDLTAPGYTVPVAYGGYYADWGTGSSFAAPLVAGTAGLMLSANPCLSSSDVTQIITSTTTPINNLYGNGAYSGKLGSGLLNAGDAVLAASNFGYSINYVPPRLKAGFNHELYCDEDLNQRLRVGGASNPIATKHQFNLYHQQSNQLVEIINGSLRSPDDYAEGGPYSYDEILSLNTDYYVKHGVWDQCQSWQEARVYNIKSTQSCVDQQDFSITPLIDNSNNILAFEVDGNLFSPVSSYELKLYTYAGSLPPTLVVNLSALEMPFSYNVPNNLIGATILKAELLINFTNGRTEMVRWEL